ncbi:MAG: hypothetical protein IPJ90_17955 [Anaerolineaceae bacterium]|nr:hypothetical protein [Anaerolineaceae bacterium]
MSPEWRTVVVDTAVFPPFYPVKERCLGGNGRCQQKPIVAKVCGWGTAVTQLTWLFSIPQKYPLMPEWRTAVADTAVFPPTIYRLVWFGDGKRPLLNPPSYYLQKHPLSPEWQTAVVDTAVFPPFYPVKES